MNRRNRGMEAAVGSGNDAEPERVRTEPETRAYDVLSCIHQARTYLNDAEFRIQRVVTRGLTNPDIYSQIRASLGLAESACYTAGEILIESDPTREADAEFRDWALGKHDDAAGGADLHRDA